MSLSYEEFEECAEQAFEQLPEELKSRVENVQIVIEDLPADETALRVGAKSRYHLLGLYEGIPLTRRGTHYGMYAVVPDKITLYKVNIERFSGEPDRIENKIREVLIHEIAHHFGMNEEEIRNAGY